MLFRNRNIWLFITATCLAFAPPPPGEAATTEKWVIIKGCTLKVDGNTNVNKFSCIIRDYAQPDTLLFQRNKSKDPTVTLTGCIGLPIASFDCMNNAMTNDLRKTLKAKTYPLLNIYFVSLKKYPALSPVQENICGGVNIELAGSLKKFDIHYRIYMDADGIIHLTGNQRIRFSDFGLTPPKKLGGMIRTNDELEVEFYINFKNAAVPG